MLHLMLTDRVNVFLWSLSAKYRGVLFHPAVANVCFVWCATYSLLSLQQECALNALNNEARMHIGVDHNFGMPCLRIRS